jgi:hypothetical protein
VTANVKRERERERKTLERTDGQTSQINKKEKGGEAEKSINYFTVDALCFSSD